MSNDVPPPSGLLEREREIAALDSAVSRPGELVVIEGAPGLGKSALVSHASRRARALGVPVLSATGTALESHVAFGVVTRLFRPWLSGTGAAERDSLFEGAASLARPLLDARWPGGAEALEALGEESAGGGEALVHGLRWFTENLVESATSRAGVDTVVLAVDDAHWSDEGSLRFLGRLVSRLPELPVTVVVALRPGEEAAPEEALTALRYHPRARVLQPGPLGQSSVERLVNLALPGADDSFSRACARATGGNPFLLDALLAELATEGVAPTAEAADGVGRMVPEAVARSVVARLGRLPEAAVSLAGAVAVMGDSTPLRMAAALAGLGEAEAEAAADALARANLLRPGDPLGFTHPLTAAAVHAGLPAFARSRAHRRAARLAADGGASVETVAAHLVAARPEADPWVVSTLRQAAERVTAAGEHRAAARFLRRALEEPPVEAERAGLEVALALAEASAGEPGSYERLVAKLGVIEDAGQRARALLTLSRLLIARGDWGTAAAAADEGLAGLAPGDPLQRPLLATFLSATSRHAPRRHEALQLFEPMVEAAREGRLPDDPVLCARLASRLATAGEPTSLVLDLAGAALAAHPLVDREAHGIPFAFAAAGIYWVEDYERCHRAAVAALDAARRVGSSLALTVASHWLASSCRRLGHLGEAVVHAERALEVRRDGWGALVGWSGAVLVLAQLDRGDLVGARDALTVAESGDPAWLDHAFVLYARAALAMDEGRPGDAFGDFLAAGRHLQNLYGIDHPGVLPWRSAAAVAAHRLGRTSQGESLAGEEVDRCRRLGLRVALGRSLRAAGSLAGGAAGLAMLEEAVALLRSAPDVVAHARALVDQGAALRRSGQSAAAREPLRDGLRVAEAAGAAPLAATAEAELHAAGGRRGQGQAASGPAAALTPTQHRIAQLVTEGLTNGQVAQRLYLTTKTVEWHLGQVYRRLQVADRHELSEVMSREG